VQSCLQNWFEQWGLPQQIRFDNGKPWANPAQHYVPSALALWLVGLGIAVTFGRPRQSTDNAVVERSHGVLADWVEPSQRAGLVELQSGLEEFAHLQRAIYPSCNGQTRLSSYPELLQTQRYYQRAKDQDIWEIQRVMDYVANFRFQRRVEKNGRITHFTEEYSIGRRYVAQDVTVYLDAESHEWIIENKNGEILKQFHAKQLTYPTIAHMAMVYRKGQT